MCMYCSSDSADVLKAKTRDYGIAERLRRLAAHHEALAAGHIKPHTPAAAEVEALAKHVIRDLVEEWL